MAEKISVIVTGEHDFTGSSTVLSDGRTVEWKELQLLNFEPIPVEKEFFEQMDQLMGELKAINRSGIGKTYF